VVDESYDMESSDNIIVLDRPSSILPVIYIAMAVFTCLMCVAALSRSW
jgi:hypothetical protein